MRTYREKWEQYLKETKVKEPYSFQRWYELHSIEGIDYETLLTRENKKRAYKGWGREKIDRKRILYYYKHWIGNKKSLAKQLGISRSTLYKALREEKI